MNLQKIETAFETEYKPKLKPLEDMREKSINVIFVGILLLPIICIIAYLMTESYRLDPRISMGIASVMIMFYYGYCRSTWNQYRYNYKQQVMNAMLSTIFPSLTFSANKSIDSKLYKKSRLYLTEANSFSGEDYISGKLGDTAIEFSELESFHTTTNRDSNGNQNTKNKTIFKGVFFVADFNKNFDCHLFIVPQRRFFSSVSTIFGDGSNEMGQLVKLENTEFEEFFEVYSSDQIEARYILSSKLMEKLVEFRQKFSNQIRISFIDGMLFIAIESSKNHFEPELFTPATSFSVVEEFYNQLTFLTDIVDDFDLNTRIWTKK
ncbi:DUF3137 domain-containing protein [Marinomonas sp.]|uniref:DUF3137 domain-containing protein n=1 Tax=Marinomonas sp. TaxID=1904862 RepID=UPI003BA93CB3